MITSTVDPSKRYTRSYHVGRLARSSVPARAGTQEEPCCKKSSMGSEKRQNSFRGNLKSVVALLFPPRFDRAAFKTRRYHLPERLNFHRRRGNHILPPALSMWLGDSHFTHLLWLGHSQCSNPPEPWLVVIRWQPMAAVPRGRGRQARSHLCVWRGRRTAAIELSPAMLRRMAALTVPQPY